MLFLTGMTEATNDENDTFHPIGLHAERLVLKLIEAREFSEKCAGADIVGSGSMAGVVKATKPDATPLENKTRHIPVVLSTVNSFVTRSRSTKSFVGVVLLASCLTEIPNPIVHTITVDVINHLSWPLSVAIQPREARRFVEISVYPDKPISLQLSNMPRLSSDEIGSPAMNTDEDTRNRVIANNLS
jgi:hypothetical protein